MRNKCAKLTIEDAHSEKSASIPTFGEPLGRELGAERLRSSRFTKGEDELFLRHAMAHEAPLSERGVGGIFITIGF